MKSPTTITWRNLIQSTVLAIIIWCTVLIAADILYRAYLGDSTLLGDPYYEDKILANERAPFALMFTWFAVGVAFATVLVMRVRTLLLTEE